MRHYSRTLRAFALALAVACAAGGAAAQNKPESQQDKPRTGVLRLLPGDAVTEHSIETSAGRIAYTATAGTLSLYDQSGDRTAAIFYTAYVAGNAAPNRPVTFVFNGGPGAASAFLHLGLVGPKILDFGPRGRDGARAQLRENPHTWLAFTDLVMIDPVGTGWSKPAKPDGGKAFWGVRRDAETMAKVIALYVAKNGRSGSPKYLLGESYGGFRAVKTARALQRSQGIIVAGIVMVSPMLEGALIFGDTYALGAALQLPSLAAAELERKGQFSEQALLAAEKFAMTEYLTTLAGPPPAGDEARQFHARVAEISGLPVEVVARTRGFIHESYLKQLRADAGKVVSHYDATFAIDDPFPERGSARGPDPVLDGVVRAYGGAFSDYARNELNFKTEMTYLLLSSEVTRNWDWHGGRQRASADDDLRELLALDPSFRLLAAHGHADMVTPYGATRYVLDHLPPIGTPGRAQLKLYRGGHMFYIDRDSRTAFSKDAAVFYRAAE